MRLWSIHPKYLDSKGLLAVWRESLLAQKVLSGKTKGYRNHPQLERFKKTRSPLAAIRAYLLGIYHEAKIRGFVFNQQRINSFRNAPVCKITVTRGQLSFEYKHLLSKFKIRDLNRYKKFLETKKISAHPVFHIVAGSREAWERGGRKGPLCVK